MFFSLVTQAADGASADRGYGLGTVIIIGLFIVFAALAVIYLAMKLMELAFRPRAKDEPVVRAPFDGRLDAIVARDVVAKDDVVAIATDHKGTRNEILSPMAGAVIFTARTGDDIRRGDPLFTVKKEATE